MKTFVLMGDSITDGCRDRNIGHQNYFGLGAGMGYANYIMSEIDYKYPKKYNVVNKGIGGNRIVDLYSRIKQDCINLNPDFLTILIGVNDVWHEYEYKCGVDIDKYYKIYSMYEYSIPAIARSISGSMSRFFSASSHWPFLGFV